MLPVENAKLLNQPPMKGFLELSEVSTHEEGLFDITDFTPFYEASDSDQETNESRESSAPASVKPRVNFQVFLKKKEGNYSAPKQRRIVVISNRFKKRLKYVQSLLFSRR